MAGYMQCTIVGNVGRDPNFKYTPQGAAVCDFSVAVTRKFGSGEQKQEKTTWFKVTCWNKQAEIANQYIRKGTPLLVVGTIDVSAYMDKNNQPQASLELRADTFQLLGGRNDNDGQGGTGGYQQQGGQQGGYNNQAEDIDQIPF